MDASAQLQWPLGSGTGTRKEGGVAGAAIGASAGRDGAIEEEIGRGAPSQQEKHHTAEFRPSTNSDRGVQPNLTIPISTSQPDRLHPEFRTDFQCIVEL